MFATAIFLATKCDNALIPINKLLESKEIPFSRQELLDYEFPLTKGLKFMFTVHHPYLPLEGFFLDMQYVLVKQRGSPTFAELLDHFGHAKRLVQQALFGDIAFLFTPSQIALAAFHATNKKLVEEYLSAKFENEKIREKLIAKLGNAEELIRKTVDFPTVEEVENTEKLCSLARDSLGKKDTN